MINPTKVIKDYKKMKITDNELNQSKEFFEFATSHGFNIFDLAFNNDKMQEAMELYKLNKENITKENDLYEV